MRCLHPSDKPARDTPFTPGRLYPSIASENVPTAESYVARVVEPGTDPATYDPNQGRAAQLRPGRSEGVEDHDIDQRPGSTLTVMRTLRLHEDRDGYLPVR